MQNWYEEPRKKTEHIFHAIIKHNFVIDLFCDSAYKQEAWKI
jgi:hypothetical protein